jgi:hypothetical protein
MLLLAPKRTFLLEHQRRKKLLHNQQVFGVGAFDQLSRACSEERLLDS